MSLVGTRPPTVDEWDKYELHHRARLATKPGLTGMWQVSGRSNITDLDKGDISDIVILDTIFKKENIESCIHFAGLKSVGESVAKPLEYYQNNIAGTLILLQKLREYNVKNIIFSSSATVYGDPAFVPITEECPKGLCTNPYGWSKSMLEQILMDIYKADETWNIILLRYFNPIGAHKSGLMPCMIFIERIKFREEDANY